MGPRRQAAWPVDQVEDTTGCGDVLGASLLATLGAGWPVDQALPLAARHAARVCAGTGLSSLDLLEALPAAS
jgi:sugar/nucleoside kinase (ribokinase family)